MNEAWATEPPVRSKGWLKVLQGAGRSFHNNKEDVTGARLVDGAARERGLAGWRCHQSGLSPQVRLAPEAPVPGSIDSFTVPPLPGCPPNQSTKRRAAR